MLPNGNSRAMRIPDDVDGLVQLLEFLRHEIGAWDLSPEGEGYLYDYFPDELLIKTASTLHTGSPGDWIVHDDEFGYFIYTDAGFRASIWYSDELETEE